MTTIAYRDGILAADTLVVGGTLRSAYVDKIALSQFAMGGSAGGLAAVALFTKWIMDLRTPLAANLHLAPEIEGGGPDGLIISEAGEVYHWAGERQLARVHGEFFAVGSGEKIAYGALAMGASAEEAVKIAAMYDVYTGGRITTLSLASPSRPTEEV